MSTQLAKKPENISVSVEIRMTIHPKRGYSQDRSHQHTPYAEGRNAPILTTIFEVPTLDSRTYTTWSTHSNEKFLQLYLKTTWWRLLKGEQLCQKSSTSKSGIIKISTPPSHYRKHDHIHCHFLMKIKWCIHMYTNTYMYIYIHTPKITKEFSTKPQLTARMLLTYQLMTFRFQNKKLI